MEQAMGQGEVKVKVKRRDCLTTGKAKSLYLTDDPERLIMLFRDDTSAFDGKKKSKLEGKGKVNNYFNARIMEILAGAGIPTHLQGLLSDTESLVLRLDMLPVECVVRNIAAGSICSRLGVEEGLELEPPTFEFFLKDDALGDPMINEYHIHSFGWADAEQVAEMKRLTFAVNEVLKALFARGGMLLVDYKLEFGTFAGKLYLGDEFTADGCRLWDADTRAKLDKDRFRQDLGGVVESYREIARRLGIDTRSNTSSSTS